MTIIIDGRRRFLGDLTAEIIRLEKLLVDLKHLAAGHLPAAANVDAAPLLEAWEIASRPSPALMGIVSGHPKIDGNRPAITSSLMVFAPELGWARTESRLYRLGTSLVDRRSQ